MATATSTKPAITTQSGLIETAVWVNNRETDNGSRTFYDTKLSRSYQKNDEWHETSMTLSRRDLLSAAWLLRWADGKIQSTGDVEPDKKPYATCKRGQIEVAIWAKRGSERVFHSVGLTRNFKDGDEWKKSTIYVAGHDLLVADRVLQRTFDSIDRLAHDNEGDFVIQAKQTVSDASAGPPDEDIPF